MIVIRYVFLKLETTDVVVCLKSLVSEHHATVNTLNSLKNWTTALPSHCFIILAKIELENFGLSVTEALAVFVNTMSPNGKYSFHNRKNLPQSIQLQLSKKEKFSSQFLATYLKFT